MGIMEASSVAQVWYQRLADPTPPDVLDRWLAALSGDERARAGRFHRASDRECYVAAHALLRQALSRLADVPPERWRFRSEARGKPEVAGPEAALGLRFSLSHTRGFAVCAVSHGIPLGVDVEHAGRTPPPRIAAKTLAPAERAALEALPEEERPGRFFEYWTLKEALLKGLGLGLTYAPERLSFSLAPGRAAVIDFPGDLGQPPDAWRFESWLIEGGYRVSLAIRPGGAPCRVTIADASLCLPRPYI
jgi:4'-phosphopantetheinyl transferase